MNVGHDTQINSPVTSPIETSSSSTTPSLAPCSTMKTKERHRFVSSIYCPCLYCQCLTSTFFDPAIFRKLTTSPTDTINLTIAKINKRFLKTYPWALGAGRDLPNAYVLLNGRNNLHQADPSSASSPHLSDLCSTASPNFYISTHSGSLPAQPCSRRCF